MQQPSILIIDDSKFDRYILSRQLKKIGISEIMEKHDGKAGIDFLKDPSHQQDSGHFPPTIIIVDVNMPIMGGFEFLQEFAELKTQFDLGRCHILMASGSDNPQEKLRAMQNDFVKGFLIKGEYTLDELKTEIAALI